MKELIPYSKIERWGVLNDIHGPYHDERAVNLVLDIYEDLAIDVLFLNGDIFDFANISRHSVRDPEMITSLEDEFYWGNQFFDDIRKRFVDKGCRVIYNRGNHEEWLNAFIMKHAKPFWNICTLEKMVNLSGIEIHPYNEPFEVYDCNLFIQHSPPSYSKVGPYNSLKEKSDASFIWGCTHRIGHATITGQSSKVYHGWFNGWLGDQELTRDHSIAFKYKKNHKTWQKGASLLTIVDKKDFYNQQFVIDKNYRACVSGNFYYG